MNVLDTILLLCFVPAVIGGLRKGFIAQVIAIVSLLLGIWLSFRFSSIVTGWLSTWIQTSENILNIISFAVIFIVVILVLGIVGRLLEATVKIILLGWLNKLLGLVFAILKYAIVIGLLLMLFNTINAETHIVKDEVLNNSALYRLLLDAASAIFPYLKTFFSTGIPESVMAA